mgnify:CR=1 FL=1
MVALALMAEKAGDLDQAIRWMEKVGSFKRKDPNSQIKLINLYHRAGRLEAAMVLAVRLKQEFASNLSVLAAVGGAELRTGAMETAAKTFRRMSNMRPDSARDLVRISFLQLDARDLEGAFNTLTRAVWVEPANMAAQREIVKLEIHMRKFDAAEKRTEDLRQSFPDSGIGEWLHGDVMMAKNNYVIAISDYQASIEKTGGNSKLATSIFLARNKANQGPAAIDGLEAWVKDHPKCPSRKKLIRLNHL